MNKQDKLNKLRDELVRKFNNEVSEFDISDINVSFVFASGFNAAVTAMQGAASDTKVQPEPECICGEINARNCPVHQHNPEPSAVAFDEAAAQIELCKWSFASTMSAFKQGARWQHQQMAAQLDNSQNIINKMQNLNEYYETELDKLRVENEELRNELCDEKYHLNIPEISFGTKAVIRPLPSKAPENQEEIKTLGALRDLKNQLSASADVEFDKVQARGVAEDLEHIQNQGATYTFVDGAQWGFEQNRAALSAMKSELENTKEELCDESYNLDKRIEMLKNAEQIILNLKAEIDKLRAENTKLYAAHPELSKLDHRTFGDLMIENAELKNTAKFTESYYQDAYSYAYHDCNIQFHAKLAAAEADVERITKRDAESWERRHEANIQMCDLMIEKSRLYIENEANKNKLSAANAEVAKWKDEYFNVSKFATDYENKLTAANEIILELEKVLETITEAIKSGDETTTELNMFHTAEEALAKLKEWRGWE